MYPSFIPANILLIGAAPKTTTGTSNANSNANTMTHTMTDAQFAFAFFSLHLLFPLLYIIISTGNIKPIMALWRFIQSGIFDTASNIKEFLTNIVYATLRVFGQYTFSTYTVVRDGREIYAASSMYFFHTTDARSVYRIDRAKYNVCKWIDKQCALYSRQYNGDVPELTETHNDIYDFILHKIDNEPYTRIHRGDFSGRTHTLSTTHYRKFPKSYEMAETAELMVLLPSSSVTGAEAEADTDTAPETFTINLKAPHHFFLEKNEFLDKKFLQWKLYNECGRKDVADYIGTPFSKYKVALCYSECMNNTNNTTNTNNYSVAYQLNDSHSILIGNKYIVKVDSVLRCPVLDSSENQVFDIDAILSSYYDCSDTADDTDSEEDSEDTETEEDTDSEEDTESETEETPEDTATTTTTTTDHDPEFEIIEDPTTVSLK
jgi:hypothetical protein